MMASDSQLDLKSRASFYHGLFERVEGLLIWPRELGLLARR
jgi:hypothetical protein